MLREQITKEDLEEPLCVCLHSHFTVFLFVRIILGPVYHRHAVAQAAGLHVYKGVHLLYHVPVQKIGNGQYIAQLTAQLFLALPVSVGIDSGDLVAKPGYRRLN